MSPTELVAAGSDQEGVFFKALLALLVGGAALFLIVRNIR